jgi:DNA-binding MarR family transcriptional regulator
MSGDAMDFVGQDEKLLFRPRLPKDGVNDSRMAKGPRKQSQERSRSLAFLLRTVHHALRMRLEENLREEGLTLPQLAALTALRQRPGLSGAALARTAFTSRQSMTKLLRALERAGWVRRCEAEHGRGVPLELTQAGDRKLRDADTAMCRVVEARLLPAMTAEEQDHLRSLLRRCIAVLGGSLESR